MLGTRHWVGAVCAIRVGCAAPEQNREPPYGASFDAPRHPKE